jgi:hypothetical protein
MSSPNPAEKLICANVRVLKLTKKLYLSEVSLSTKLLMLRWILEENAYIRGFYENVTKSQKRAE